MNDVLNAPIERSKVVSVLIRPNLRVQRGEGDKLENDRLYIGASLHHQSPLSGLSPFEEDEYLPAILGMTKNDDGWKKAVRNYWNNIRKIVPDGGLELETGFYYKTQQDAQDGKEGYPMNISDYILWRYCLKYSKVANTIYDIDSSPKIKFYLSDPATEENVEYAKVQKTLKANKYLAELILPDNANKLDDVLTLYGYNVAGMSMKSKIVTIHDLGADDSKDPSKIARFLNTYEDKLLRSRSWISRAVSYGILTRLPNTDTIQYRDHITLGTTTEAAIAFLDNDPQGQQYKLEIDSALMTKSRGTLSGDAVEHRTITHEVVVDKAPDNDPLGDLDNSASGPIIDTGSNLKRTPQKVAAPK